MERKEEWSNLMSTTSGTRNIHSDTFLIHHIGKVVMNFTSRRYAKIYPAIKQTNPIKDMRKNPR